jgi:hypothetical protein
MLKLSFQRFFGLPRLRTPRGRLSLTIFARQLSSILSTWVSITTQNAEYKIPG